MSEAVATSKNVNEQPAGNCWDNETLEPKHYHAALIKAVDIKRIAAMLDEMAFCAGEKIIRHRKVLPGLITCLTIIEESATYVIENSEAPYRNDNFEVFVSIQSDMLAIKLISQFTKEMLIGEKKSGLIESCELSDLSSLLLTIKDKAERTLGTLHTALVKEKKHSGLGGSHV
ncbi:MAG: hypothetical protein IJD16_04345 [Desulfovibrio sp.]|nr:hypothetical protein [Desulfovibrio sp.]